MKKMFALVIMAVMGIYCYGAGLTDHPALHVPVEKNGEMVYLTNESRGDSVFVYITASSASINPGDSVQLEAVASGDTMFSYSWSSIPSGFSSTLSNPVVIPSATTTYLVTVTGATSGSVASDQVTIQVINSQVRRIVLLEQFVNAYCAPTAYYNLDFESNILNKNQENVLHIAYHVHWPGSNDPMYLYNTSQIIDRVNYYNVNATPALYMLGKTWEGVTNELTQSMIDAQTAIESPVRINLSQVSNGSTMTINVTVKTQDSVPSGDYKLRVAIVEDPREYTTAPGTNGEKHFRNVFRKMLPDTGGDSYIPSALNDSVVFSYTFDLDTMNWIISNIHPVVFIQNETDKKILDAATIGSVIINMPPDADFTATPLSCKPGDSIQFTDRSSHFPTSWHWDFGDGNTSSLQNPVHVYNSHGQFTVMLFTSNEYGMDSLIIPNYITVSPVSVFITASSLSINPGDSVQLEAVASGDSLFTYTWSSLPEGISSTISNPVVAPSVSTLYSVTITGATSGYSATDDILIHVNNNNLQLFYQGIPLTENDTINISTSSTNEICLKDISIKNIGLQMIYVKVKKEEISVVPDTRNNFIWNNICYAPSIYTSGPRLFYPQETDSSGFAAYYLPQTHSGSSIIRYEFFNADDTTDRVSVYVRYYLGLTVYTQDETITCGNQVPLNISTNAGYGDTLSYAWSPAQGLSDSTVAIPFANPLTTTTYTVTVTGNGGETATGNLTVTVNPFLVIAYAEINGSTTGTIHCGETAVLKINTNYSGLDTLIYRWSPPAGLSDTTASNPLASPSATTTYWVHVESPSGCSSSSQITLNVDAVDPVDICMVDISNNKNVVIWEKPVSNGIDTFYIYRESKDYTGLYQRIGKTPYASVSKFTDITTDPAVQSNRYKLSAKDQCGLESSYSNAHKTMHLTINKGQGNNWNLIWEEYEGFDVISYKIFRGKSLNNLKQIGSTTAGNTTYADINAPTGTLFYQIRVTMDHTCNPTRDTSYYSFSSSNIVSSEELNSNELQVNVFPNPVEDILIIGCTNDQFSNAQVSINSIDGRSLSKYELLNNKTEIQIKDLTAGVYILFITDDKGVAVRRIVKK